MDKTTCSLCGAQVEGAPGLHCPSCHQPDRQPDPDWAVICHGLSELAIHRYNQITRLREALEKIERLSKSVESGMVYTNSAWHCALGIARDALKEIGPA